MYRVSPPKCLFELNHCFGTIGTWRVPIIFAQTPRGFRSASPPHWLPRLRCGTERFGPRWNWSILDSNLEEIWTNWDVRNGSKKWWWPPWPLEKKKNMPTFWCWTIDFQTVKPHIVDMILPIPWYWTYKNWTIVPSAGSPIPAERSRTSWPPRVPEVSSSPGRGFSVVGKMIEIKDSKLGMKEVGMSHKKKSFGIYHSEWDISPPRYKLEHFQFATWDGKTETSLNMLDLTHNSHQGENAKTTWSILSRGHSALKRMEGLIFVQICIFASVYCTTIYAWSSETLTSSGTSWGYTKIIPNWVDKRYVSSDSTTDVQSIQVVVFKAHVGDLSSYLKPQIPTIFKDDWWWFGLVVWMLCQWRLDETRQYDSRNLIYDIVIHCLSQFPSAGFLNESLHHLQFSHPKSASSHPNFKKKHDHWRPCVSAFLVLSCHWGP